MATDRQKERKPHRETDRQEERDMRGRKRDRHKE